MKFVFISEYMECGSLMLLMKMIEKQDVRTIVYDTDYYKILDELIKKEKDFVQYQGEKNIFVTDNVASGKIADSLRKKGELVIGGSEISDRIENDRQFGQEVMRKYGIKTMESTNFTGFEATAKALEFIEKNQGRWVIKQNIEDKTLSAIGKFENGDDIKDRLHEMKRIWTEEVNFDLQKYVDGYEVGVEGWFNGREWVTDKNGEKVFIINFEHKKLSNGDLGRATGEVGTLSYRTHANAHIGKELEKLTPLLRQIKYIGNIDINFILGKNDKRFYGLEFTNRFGFPSLDMAQSYVRTSWAEFFEKLVRGENNFLDVDPRWCVVIVVHVPPFPFSAAHEGDNAVGQRVYFLKDGKWSGNDVFTTDKLRSIHPYEIKYDKETKEYIATGDSGYLTTVSEIGNSPKEANEKTLKYIKDNLYTLNMNYRTDIGVNERVKESIAFLEEKKLI